jgi:hypothetical protein
MLHARLKHLVLEEGVNCMERSQDPTDEQKKPNDQAAEPVEEDEMETSGHGDELQEAVDRVKEAGEDEQSQRQA